MKIAIEAQPLPLRVGKDGVIRVGNTRVTLDTVIEAFLEGSSAEEIVQQYPSLSLSDIYSVIGYYLQQTDKVNEYLAVRKKVAQKIKEENEIRFNPYGIRARLLARNKNKIKQ